jgi:hypothetical protein
MAAYEKRPKWWEVQDTVTARVVRHYGGTKATAKRMSLAWSTVSKWRWAGIPKNAWRQIVSDRAATFKELAGL